MNELNLFPSKSWPSINFVINILIFDEPKRNHQKNDQSISNGQSYKIDFLIFRIDNEFEINKFNQLRGGEFCGKNLHC